MLTIFCVSLVVLCFCSCSTPEDKSLKSVAEFPIGTAVRINSLVKDSKLREIQNREFNSITAGNDMKMNRVMPSAESFQWETVDKFVSYGEDHGQRLFGHNLIWHSSTPDWVVEKGRADSLWMADFMRAYIHTYVSRYKGRVDAWDVVNEGLETFGGEFRKTMWYDAMGPEYIAKAFEYAHEADPDAILFYNDFNLERDTAKLNGVLALIKNMQDRGVPISGFGLQMHIRMDIPNDLIKASLVKAAETGLQIHLSELDIIFNTHDDSRGGGVQIVDELTDEMKVQQAEKYRAIVEMYREVVPPAQQYGITFWGFNDRDTWIRSFFDLNDWPCIYDDDLERKPAYWGFYDGLQSEIVR